MLKRWIHFILWIGYTVPEQHNYVMRNRIRRYGRYGY